MEECKKMVEKRQMPSDTKWMNFSNGMVENNKGNYEQALELYSKSWPNILFIKYYMAILNKNMGNHEEASELFKEFEKWNQANLQYALVRYRMKNIDNK